jgi:hypothetical protein
MPLWMWIVMLLVLIKLPIAALMLWLPFRNDEAMRVAPAPEASDEDGGSPVLGAGPIDPRPHHPGSPRVRPRPPHPAASLAPRRGSPGCPPAPGTRRVRTVADRRHPSWHAHLTRQVRG